MGNSDYGWVDPNNYVTVESFMAYAKNLRSINHRITMTCETLLSPVVGLVKKLLDKNL